MRSVLLVVIATISAAGTVGAVEDQVYRWTDRTGHLHFSNVPAPGAEATGIVSDEDLPVSPPGEPVAPPDDAAPPPVPQQQSDGAPLGEAESGQVSLQRDDLQRQIRESERQLQALNGRLSELATVRTRFAKGAPVGGGLATNAAAFTSDEEKALAEQRDSLRANVDRLRADYAKLH